MPNISVSIGLCTNPQDESALLVNRSIHSSSASLKLERGRINFAHNSTKVGQECRTSLIVAVISFRAPGLMWKLLFPWKRRCHWLIILHHCAFDVIARIYSMVMRDEFRGFHLFQLMRYALVRRFIAGGKKKARESNN